MKLVVGQEVSLSATLADADGFSNFNFGRYPIVWTSDKPTKASVTGNYKLNTAVVKALEVDTTITVTATATITTVPLVQISQTFVLDVIAERIPTAVTLSVSSVKG